MHQSKFVELLSIRSLEDSYDNNEHVNQCITTLMKLVDSLTKGIDDIYQTTRNIIYPRLEKLLDDSSKKTREYKKSRVIWRELQISFDKLSVVISMNLVEVTQRLPLMSQLLHHYNYLRQERSNLSLSHGTDHPKLLGMSKQMENVSKLYNTETKQYNKVINSFKNTIEYINNNRIYDKIMPPGKVVIALKDIFAKLNDWLLSYKKIPSETRKKASDDIEVQFRYLQIAVQKISLLKLVELNDYIIEYIDH